MKVCSTIKELNHNLAGLPDDPPGFVPTMGALHEGHLSLVKEATMNCPLVVVSIFVNPTQFNDKKDLLNYPRTIESDLEMLENVLRPNDIVFTPDVSEIYPYKDKRVFNFGNLDNVMEAVHRPGHFNGVAQVVSRLFEIVRPQLAYFGQKDFQQLAVIKELVRQEKIPVKIITCPIIRESDGLAMSSRNRLLEPDIRKNSPVIYRTLCMAAEMINEYDIPAIKQKVLQNINAIPGFAVEYFEIADDAELIPLENKKGMRGDRKYFGCIAVKAGSIRLIDNKEIRLA